MGETFKRMMLGHKDRDGWGNYAKYSAPIWSMHRLMKTVLINSTPGFLRNEVTTPPISDMGNTVRDQVAHEKDGETTVGQNYTLPTDNNIGMDKIRTPGLTMGQTLKEESDLGKIKRADNSKSYPDRKMNIKNYFLKI